MGSALCILGFFYPTPDISIAFDFPYCRTVAAEPPIAARAAYAYDVQSGAILFEKDSDAQLPLASLTKIMTVLTASQALTPTTTVEISKDALTPEGESGLTVGEKWRVKDLADFTLITSSNDGARALMLASSDALHMRQEDFYAAMNRRAEALNLSGTYFINETGLDVSSSTAGAYGSARDVAHLLAYASTAIPALVDGSVKEEETFTSLSGINHKATNTSSLAATLIGSIASKTGYTDLAGGNLAVIYEPVPGRPVAIAVLGSTREGRDDDVRILSTYAGDVLKRDILCSSL